jgi:hypothetical protein
MPRGLSLGGTSEAAADHGAAAMRPPGGCGDFLMHLRLRVERTADPISKRFCAFSTSGDLG